MHGITYNPDDDPGYGMGQYPRQKQGTQADGPLGPTTDYDHIGVDFV